MKKRVLFWSNKEQREKYINLFIIEELYSISKNIEVKIIYDGNGNDVIDDVLLFDPDIIITYPITTDYQINNYSIAKLLCKCHIICFSTEGFFCIDEPQHLEWLVGMYSYSKRLVDYECFWGKILAEIRGNYLLKDDRLDCGSRQIKVFGYPMYEKSQFDERFSYYYTKIEKRKQNYRKLYLFVTGFPYVGADLTQISNLPDVYNVDGKDSMTMQEQVEKFEKEYVEPERIYCKKYIDLIIKCAENNKQDLVVVKLHPLEIAHYPLIEALYGKMEKYDNIWLLKESIPIALLFKHADIFVHYGSTTVLEAYIYKVPTVVIECAGYTKTSTIAKSDIVLDIDDTESFLQIFNNNIQFKKNESVENVLSEYMNYYDDKPYHPSKDFAEFIMQKKKKQHLRLKDVSKNLIDSYEREVFERMLVALGNKEGKERFQYVTLYLKLRFLQMLKRD